MRLFRGRKWLLLALIIGLSACQSAPRSHGQQSGRPTARAASPDPQRCDRLAKRGFTPCPPTPDHLQLPPTTIRNATNGAVSDATAQQWGRAFQLTEAYYRWALQTNTRAALTSGVLSDSSQESVANLFAHDLMELDSARSVNGILVVQPLELAGIQVVAIPRDLQDSMRQQSLDPTSYGLAVHFMGPSRRAIQLPNGGEQVLSSSDSSYSAWLLIWGTYKADPELGAIWYEHGNYGCDGVVRNVCQV
jgi:hypothetical protein